MKMEDKPKRRRLNREERRSWMAAAVELFVQRYGRKARRGGLDSNDRSYDRDLQRQVECMAPEQLDRLMRGEEE